MEPITLERYLNEPGLGGRLHAAARRARSHEMHRLLKALVGWFTPQPRVIHWVARLG